MSPTIRGALKHAVFLGFVSVALLSAAALGGGGCPPADAAASTVPVASGARTETYRVTLAADPSTVAADVQANAGVGRLF